MALTVSAACVKMDCTVSVPLGSFVTVNGSRVADHKRSFHDDSIMGMAISIYVVNFEKMKYN